VFYQEGPGSKKFINYEDENAENIYRWEIFKRYSNFVDLSEALLPIFKTENIEPPQLPPKIEIHNDSQRNFNLTERKKQLQGYLRQVLKCLAHRMPPHLLIFLGLHDQNSLGYFNSQ
jgi:hypothetical protein